MFGYPSDKKNVNGKLRLLSEGAPMSFLMEQAGGLSTDGRGRVMEIVPKEVHQVSPSGARAKQHTRVGVR